MANLSVQIWRFRIIPTHVQDLDAKSIFLTQTRPFPRAPNVTSLNPHRDALIYVSCTLSHLFGMCFMYFVRSSTNLRPLSTSFPLSAFRLLPSHLLPSLNLSQTNHLQNPSHSHPQLPLERPRQRICSDADRTPSAFARPCQRDHLRGWLYGCMFGLGF